jgi:hypothetical protein
MRRPVRDFVIRLVIIAAILLTLGRLFGTTLVTPILPAFAWTIEATGDRFRVDRMTVVEGQRSTFIQLQATPVRPLVLGNKVLLPDGRLQFSPTVLVGSVLQPIILLLSIVLAWPARNRWTMPLRLLFAAPTIVLLLATNAPLGLVGAMLDFREILPAVAVDPLVYWNDFLQTGGPLVMAIAAGIILVSIADRWARVPIHGDGRQTTGAQRA